MGKATIKVTPLSEAVRVSENKAILPAGRYFIGDLCYTAGEDDNAWSQWVEVAAAHSNDFVDPVAGANYNDWPLVAVSTLYGDGTYEDNKGRVYGVDAGSIGAAPESFIEAFELTDEDLTHAGHWETFEEDFELSITSAGVIHIGHLTIPTGD